MAFAHMLKDYLVFSFIPNWFVLLLLFNRVHENEYRKCCVLLSLKPFIALFKVPYR